MRRTWRVCGRELRVGYAGWSTWGTSLLVRLLGTELFRLLFEFEMLVLSVLRTEITVSLEGLIMVSFGLETAGFKLLEAWN